MIEQGRLRAWIDQPLGLLYFESRHEDADRAVAGTAGGLGVEREEKAVEPVSWTERWDDRIRDTSLKVSPERARRGAPRERRGQRCAMREAGGASGAGTSGQGGQEVPSVACRLPRSWREQTAQESGVHGAKHGTL